MPISRILTTLILLNGLICFSQPAGYYSSADGKTGTQLQQALHDIIDNHTVLTYDYLWTAFQSSDRKPDGTVWDMYSDIPGGTPAYTYQFITGQCGNYNSEGDCYNREHSFPKSWFNDLEPMVTDLFHIFPTDGWVNNKRGNYPFGVTSNPSWISTNGSKLGNSSYPGYSGIVFEPLNAYKGDFARTYFYMAVRYFNEDAGWTGSDMATGAQPKEWALKMLLEWHKNDPVSQKETDRNEIVYSYQHNRNPFIDNPAYAEKIWGSPTGSDNLVYKDNMLAIYPAPSQETIYYDLRVKDGGPCIIRITSIAGSIVTVLKRESGQGVIDVSSFHPGIYFIAIERDKRIYTARFVVSGY